VRAQLLELRVAAGNQTLTGVVRVGELEEVALIEEPATQRLGLGRFSMRDAVLRATGLGETRLPGTDAAVIDEVGGLEQAGATVTQVVPPRTASMAQLLDWMEWFGEEVVRRFKTNAKPTPAA